MRRHRRRRTEATSDTQAIQNKVTEDSGTLTPWAASHPPRSSGCGTNLSQIRLICTFPTALCRFFRFKFSCANVIIFDLPGHYLRQKKKSEYRNIIGQLQ